MRNASLIVPGLAILLCVAEVKPVVAAHYRVPECHWGYANNCEYLVTPAMRAAQYLGRTPMLMHAKLGTHARIAAGASLFTLNLKPIVRGPDEKRFEW
jgi:hypothetical protein